MFRYRKSRPRNRVVGFRYNCYVAKQACANRAEWRLPQGKDAVRLSSYYQLGCDYGTTMMISWANGGVAPIYLCESHVAMVGRSAKSSEDVLATTAQSVPSNLPTEQPKSSPPSSSPPGGPPGSPPDAQVSSGTDHLAVVTASLPELASGDSAKVLVDEAAGNTAGEDFEAHGMVLQLVKSSAATEEKQAEADLERLCVSRYGVRCSAEATVHCPRCGRWLCDAHAEDEKWHPCPFTV
jgi:hypothetical protein